MYGIPLRYWQQLWNVFQIEHGSKEFWSGYILWLYVSCYLDLCDMNLAEGHDLSLGYGQQLREIFSRSRLTVKINSPDMDWGECLYYDLDLRYIPGAMSRHTLGSWTTFIWNIIHIGQGSKTLWSWQNVNRRTDKEIDILTCRVLFTLNIGNFKNCDILKIDTLPPCTLKPNTCIATIKLIWCMLQPYVFSNY